MNRPFPRFEVVGLAATLVFGASCSPSNSVKPGAPVLIEMSIVENGGASITTVTPSTVGCPGTPVEGGPCDPAAYPVCASAITNTICRCVPTPAAAAVAALLPGAVRASVSDAGVSDAAVTDAATVADAAAIADAAVADAATTDAGAVDAASDAAVVTPAGTWSCSFSPSSSVLYVFDRLLYTPTLDPGDGGGVFDVAKGTFTPLPPPSPVFVSADYASNGSPNEIIFPLLGDFRSDGPSLLISGVPALPAGTTVNLALDKTKVLAKDGRTPFTGTNLLADGLISFATQAFAAAIAPPPAPAAPADAGADAAAPGAPPDMTPATITFNNRVDPVVVAAHVTVTALPLGGGAAVAVPVDVASMDGLNVTIVPSAAATWPASSTISITVDAAAPDVVGDTLGAVVTQSFTTSAM